MYPRHYFDLFRPDVKERRVFIGMSFATEDNMRWREIIEPAVKECGFEPFRTDAEFGGDSVLDEIMNGLLTSRLLVFDISEKPSGERNGNVMYEVGLAHAIRHPEEILIIKSDSSPVLFDISSIRIHRYDLDRPDTARNQIAAMLKSLENGLCSLHGLVLKKTVDVLDEICLGLMQSMGGRQYFSLLDPQKAFTPEVSEQREAVRRLLDLNIIVLCWDKKNRSYAYTWTYFGRVLLNYLAFVES